MERRKPLPTLFLAGFFCALCLAALLFFAPAAWAEESSARVTGFSIELLQKDGSGESSSQVEAVDKGNGKFQVSVSPLYTQNGEKYIKLLITPLYNTTPKSVATSTVTHGAGWDDLVRTGDGFTLRVPGSAQYTTFKLTPDGGNTCTLTILNDGKITPASSAPASSAPASSAPASSAPASSAPVSSAPVSSAPVSSAPASSAPASSAPVSSAPASSVPASSAPSSSASASSAPASSGQAVGGLDIDTDGDGKADLNIDTDGDGKADLNIDITGDGEPDVNLDVDSDGKPDVNIDLDGDGKLDLNIDLDGDGVPDIALPGVVSETSQPENLPPSNVFEQIAACGGHWPLLALVVVLGGIGGVLVWRNTVILQRLKDDEEEHK